MSIIIILTMYVNKLFGFTVVYDKYISGFNDIGHNQCIYEVRKVTQVMIAFFLNWSFAFFRSFWSPNYAITLWVIPHQIN